MYAIEFEATIKNGMIPIPQRYLAQLQPHLRVIVLQEEPSVTTETSKQQETFCVEDAMGFDRIKIDTTQWKFRRTEIYERGQCV